MYWRIIDISNEPASLSVSYDQLVITRETSRQTVPLDELAVLIVAHPRVSFTQAVLNGIINNGGAFIICDDKRLPSGQLLPLSANSIQTERLAIQVNASKTAKKSAWKQIVKAKIAAQARTLEHYIKSDLGLFALAKKVSSGDSGNFEAKASHRYWQALYGPDFRRIYRSEDPINILLNYGYAVLRSIVARAICASGFHPSLGIHHHNKYDPFCLADDLMEPFRPKVDRAVKEASLFFGNSLALDNASKEILLKELLEVPVPIGGEGHNVFEASLRCASSLADLLAGKRRLLLLPEV